MLGDMGLEGVRRLTSMLELKTNVFRQGSDPFGASPLRLLLLVHTEHALGDEEAAEDVH